jgi:cytochrome c553
MSTAPRGAIWTRVALAAGLALAAACTPENGPLMRPGEDCMRCHGGHGGEEEEGPRWTVAGTAYGPGAAAGVQDVHVQVTDRNGKLVSMRTNGVGNFYSAEDLALPFTNVCVERGGVVTCMRSAEAGPAAFATGACNSCHIPGGEASRIVSP